MNVEPIDPAPAGAGSRQDLPSLSVVIPVFNEPDWIGPIVDDLSIAIERSPFADAELVIVDDGSAQPTVEALDRLAPPFAHRVLRQRNAGRFVARNVGVEAARGDLILLLDSRVSLHPDALRNVAGEIAGRHDLPIWNGHVDIAVHRNPFARFWNVLTDIAFREYFAHPRRTSFGLEDFDAFPKGTTCFLAPKALLQRAIEQFDTAYEDARHSNDDTVMIRALAAWQPINIGPGFRCTYRSRDALGPFLRHAFHRGGVFVDGYGRPGTRFFGAIVLFYPSSILAALLLARRPRRVIAAALAADAVGSLGVVAYRRSVADGAVLGALAPVFAVVYGAGMWRGLALAAGARLRRSAGRRAA